MSDPKTPLVPEPIVFPPTRIHREGLGEPPSNPIPPNPGPRVAPPSAPNK